MTYPQQPYGGQGPYGQGQQPGQYGGYPQYPPPTGQYGYDPYATQYGGGYGGPPPPPKRNTGAIVAVVVAVVVVLGGLGITGFVAPGFFLSEDKSDNAGGGGTTTETSQPSDGEDGGGGADAFIEELVAAADDQDRAALTELTCADAESNVQQAIRDIDETSGAELADTEEVSDDEVRVMIDITVDDETGTFETLVVRTDGEWCWQDIRLGGPSSSDGPTGEPSRAPSGDSGEGVTLVEDFVAAINEGDSDTATGMLCPTSSIESEVTDAINADAALEIDESTMQADEMSVAANLEGEVDGEPVSTARTTAFKVPDGWCILTFFAF